MQKLFKNNVRRVVALCAIVGLYCGARLPTLPDEERGEMAARFDFQSFPLPQVAGPESRGVRPVHPSLKHIAAWISSVGAAVSLSDLDGDGLPNDVCYVDTRTDQVIVAPVPGTGSRYKPFVLSASRPQFDRATMAPTGCIPGDLNEDGRMDVLVYYWGRPPIAFLRRASASAPSVPLDAGTLDAGQFVARDVADRNERWYTNAATRADVDGDGHVDLVIGNYFQDGARILDTGAAGSEQMQSSMSRAYNGGRNRLLLWTAGTSGENPTVAFREAEDVFDEENAHAWTLGIAAADLDGDLLPELYFANDFGPDRLLHNRSQPGKPQLALLEGKRTLTTPRSKTLGRDSFKGMGVDFGDVNGDGLLDIYVSNIAKEYALQESHFLFVSTGDVASMAQGVAPYADRSEALGVSRSSWGWESRFGDFDNDGVLELIQATGFTRGDSNRWPELHEVVMGNDELLRHPKSWHRFEPGDDLCGNDHNPFFVRASDGRYYDIAEELGIGDGQITRGIATADVDGDGDLDFAIANQWEPSRFYLNKCPRRCASLGLRLLLPLDAPDTTRPAIGAAATVHLPDGRKLVGQVDGGNGHSGTRSPELHFGLGELPSGSLLQVDLRWRSTDGSVHRESLRLSPGRHTIVLGQSSRDSSPTQTTRGGAPSATPPR